MGWLEFWSNYFLKFADEHKRLNFPMIFHSNFFFKIRNIPEGLQVYGQFRGTLYIIFLLNDIQFFIKRIPVFFNVF